MTVLRSPYEIEHGMEAPPGRPVPLKTFDLAPCMYRPTGFKSDDEPDVEALELAPGAEPVHGWAYCRRDEVAALLTYISTALHAQKEAKLALEGLLGYDPQEPSFHEIEGERPRKKPELAHEYARTGDSDGAPLYTDEELEKLAAGGNSAAAEEVKRRGFLTNGETLTSPPGAQIVDLMQALKASLAATGRKKK